jgi:hypothetical protein
MANAASDKFSLANDGALGVSESQQAIVQYYSI